MAQETTPEVRRSPAAQCILNYKAEAEEARRNRETLNRQNFECYHLKQDYSHKKRGQSKEFLAKQSMAVEELCSFFQQGLMDFGEWFRVGVTPGVDEDKAIIKPEEAQHILGRQLEKNSFANYFHDALKLGVLGSLMIMKVGGKYVKKATYEARQREYSLAKSFELVRKDQRIWQLHLDLVRQEDYFPDPKGRGLYEIERLEMDWHELYEKALEDSDYDLSVVRALGQTGDDLQDMKKARETGQNVTYSGFRKRIVLYEMWGTIIEEGTGQVIHENCRAIIDVNGNEVMPPTRNPYWDGTSPYIVCPILRVPKSVWHKALMDAPTRHNVSLNELFNLIVDAGMMEAHGIKQLHANWLENPSQVSGGIAPGTTLLVNSQCPPGMKALERVDTSAVTPESINVYQLIDREFQQSALTNDTRVGALPQRAVKATEVVASNQALTGIINGIVKVIEDQGVAALLKKAWSVIAQHIDELDADELAALLADDRGKVVSNLAPEQVFAATVTQHVYQVFGLSMTLNKIQDYRKIQALLQSIGASPQMMQEFTRKYSMTKLLGQIMKSLDIDEEKIEASPEELQQRAAEMQMMAQAQAAGQNTQGGEGSNPQSQIPQAVASSSEGSPMFGARAMNNVGMTTPG